MGVIGGFVGNIIGANANYVYGTGITTSWNGSNSTWTSYKLEVEEEFYNEIGRFGWPVFTGWNGSAYASGTISIYPITTTWISTTSQPITWASYDNNT